MLKTKGVTGLESYIDTVASLPQKMFAPPMKLLEDKQRANDMMSDSKFSEMINQ
jgi:hypothetical protein